MSVVTTDPRTATTGPGLCDGRVARGERTRRALAESMISLLEEGDPNPTARRIAERAGVSLRLVFHHFDDVEALLRAAVAVQAERHWWRVKPISRQYALPRRVGKFVRQRSALYESIGAVRRVALAMEPGSPAVASELERSRRLLRDHLEDTFEAELESLSRTSRTRVVNALEAATSFETWNGVRRSGKNTLEARQALETLLVGVLGGERANRGDSRARGARPEGDRRETTS